MNRRWLLWAALACTLFACWWVEQADPEPGKPGDIAASGATKVPRKVRLSQALPALARPAPLAGQAPALPVAVAVDTSAINLFAALEMPGAAQAADTAPAAVNPYTYAGRLSEAGHWVVFLTDGEQQYVLRQGDRFAEGWQVALLDQQKVVLLHADQRFEIRLDNGVVF